METAHSPFAFHMGELRNHIESLVEPSQAARAAREVVTKALSDPGFRVSAAELGLATLASKRKNGPVHVEPDSHWQHTVHFMYWPPRSSAQPHTHLSWTVTGILVGKLHVTTYEPLTNTPVKDVDAAAGEVGYIDPPCTHSVANHTDEPAVSIHVFTPQVRSENEPPVALIQEGQASDLQFREWAVRGLLSMCEAAGGPGKILQLEQLSHAKLPFMRLLAVKLLAEIDELRAADLLRKMLPDLPTRMRVRATLALEAIL